MTCIVGLVDEDKVLIGGDSAGVAGNDLRMRRDRKVFRRSGPGEVPWVFGFTSSFRMGQLLRYKVGLPDARGVADDELEEFMVTAFVDKLRTGLKAGGWAKKDEEQERAGTFLVGVRGRLWTIMDDYQIGESMWSFAACGSGEDYALGSLATTEPPAVVEATERVRRALAAAESFSTGVAGPFHVVST